MNYFIKWQEWANQFLEANTMPAKEIHITLYMLSLFQSNKSCQVIRMLNYVIKYLINFLQQAKNYGVIPLLRF